MFSKMFIYIQSEKSGEAWPSHDSGKSLSTFIIISKQTFILLMFVIITMNVCLLITVDVTNTSPEFCKAESCQIHSQYILCDDIYWLHSLIQISCSLMYNWPPEQLHSWPPHVFLHRHPGHWHEFFSLHSSISVLTKTCKNKIKMSDLIGNYENYKITFTIMNTITTKSPWATASLGLVFL